MLFHNVFSQIGYTNAKLMFEQVYKLIEDVYVEHKQSLDAENPRDFIDVFIKQINASEQVKRCLTFLGFFNIVKSILN